MQLHARSKQTELLADAAALHAAVSELVRLYQVRDREKICCHDISVTQCSALEALVERGAMRSQQLAAVLMLDKSTTTRVVDALVRKGHVERTPDLEDRRAVSLRVSRSGRRLYDRINQELIAQQAELLRDLDPKLRNGVTDVIRRLAAAADARFRADGSSCAARPQEGCCG